MGKTAAFPVIGLALDASGIATGLKQTTSLLRAGTDSIKSTLAPMKAAFSAAFSGIGIANQVAEFMGKIVRILGEPFRLFTELEEQFSKFSILSSGTKEAGEALDRFKAIGRETGLSLKEMGSALDTLLQGHFSFAGAVVQIQDLSKVAGILGEGALPMLAAAAAKFRSTAFAGFEDVNAIALQGLPIFEAIGQQLGINAEQAKAMAKNGMITGLQARNALNAAGDMAAGKNAGAEPQTLAGQWARIKEEFGQFLAGIGAAVSHAFDFPTMLSIWRGVLSGLRAVLDAAFSPLKNVLARNGGDIGKVFEMAQKGVIWAVRKLGDGFFSFLDVLKQVTNGMVDVVETIRGLGRLMNPARWFEGEFTPDQEKKITDFQKANAKMMPGRGNGGMPPGFGWKQPDREVLMPRFKAIEALRQQKELPPAKLNLDLDVKGMREGFNKFLDGVADGANGGNKAQEEAAAKAARLAENFNQARDALQTFGEQFKNTFATPFDESFAQLNRLGGLMRDAVGAGMDQAMVAKMGDQALLGIGKGLVGMMADASKQIADSQINTVHEVGSAALYESIVRAQAGGGGASTETKLAQTMELQRQIQAEQLKSAQEAVIALRALLAKPAGNNMVGKI